MLPGFKPREAMSCTISRASSSGILVDRRNIPPTTLSASSSAAPASAEAPFGRGGFSATSLRAGLGIAVIVVVRGKRTAFMHRHHPQIASVIAELFAAPVRTPPVQM